MLRYLNPVYKNPAKTRNVDKEFAKQLYFRSIQFPILKKKYVKIIKIKQYFPQCIWLWRWNTILYLYFITSFWKTCRFLLLSSSKKSYYVLIKDFNRFMTNKTDHHVKKPFCWYFLQCFSSSRVLQCCLKICLAINNTKSVSLPEEIEYGNFQNFKRLTKALFIIYWDFECLLIPSTDNIDFGPDTKKYQNHVVCIYGYKLICVDGQYSKSYETYFGEDAIDKFLNDMIKETKYCSEMIETEFSKPIVITEKDHDNFENSTKCWICKREYEEGEVKVKDHDHITRKYWGSAHNHCNINFSLSRKIPAVFHNLLNYGSHLIFQEIGNYFKINVSLKTLEKYISFTIQQPKKKDIKSGLPLVFIGRVHYLNNLLGNLIKNIGKKDFYHVNQKFNSNVLELLKKKDFSLRLLG